MSNMNLKFTPVLGIDQIKKGDRLVLRDESKIYCVTVKTVQTIPMHGTEVIYRKKKNHFFNLDMYLKGDSWVRAAYVISAG